MRVCFFSTLIVIESCRGGVSWILSMWPNIYPNVDGEVAYAVNPITGLPMVTFKSSLNASIPNTVTLTLLRDVHIDTLM